MVELASNAQQARSVFGTQNDSVPVEFAAEIVEAGQTGRDLTWASRRD